MATKAWNRLFAVADWATSRQKQANPPKPAPSLRDTFKQIKLNQEVRRALDAWQPRSVSEGDPGYADEPVYQLAVEYLRAWEHKNYGRMGQLLSSLVREDDNKTAGMVRESCIGFELTEFSIQRLDFEAPAVCEIDVTLTFANDTKPGRMRWIREGKDGMGVAPNQPGEWRLILWGPWSIVSNNKQNNDA